jgi:hypothetical protein
LQATVAAGRPGCRWGAVAGARRGGQDDAIYRAGNAGLAIHGTDEMVFAGKDDATINDFSKGLRLDIGPTCGHDVLMGFLSDPTAVIDLAGGVGGYADTAVVLLALTDDGHGGTLVPLGGGSGLDFVGVAPLQLYM